MSSDDLLINIKFFFEFFLETCFGEEGETLAGLNLKTSNFHAPRLPI
jgi:hypothetical protein